MKNLFIIFVSFLFCLTAYSQNDKPLIRFGLIADIQYCSCENAGKRFYRNSLNKLEESVSDLNNKQVQFTINLGDLVDRKYTDIDSVLAGLNKLKAKVYNTTGNHDYGGVDNNDVLFKKLGMPAEYYSFKKANWRFIIINTNEIASYSNVAATEKEQELSAMLEEVKANKQKNGYEWNGGISKKQKLWLEKLLAKSEKKGEKVLIFSHHPLYPETALSALNSRDILNIIDNYTCVKALFAGHHHPGDFAYFKHIPSITVEGVVETENENAYGIVSIYEDKIVLEGKGRVKSRELKFR